MCIRDREQIEHLGGWELDYRLGVFMDALRCPEDDRPIKILSLIHI